MPWPRWMQRLKREHCDDHQLRPRHGFDRGDDSQSLALEEGLQTRLRWPDAGEYYLEQTEPASDSRDHQCQARSSAGAGEGCCSPDDDTDGQHGRGRCCGPPAADWPTGGHRRTTSTRREYGASGSSRLLTPSQCTTGTPSCLSEYLIACCSSRQTRAVRPEILLPS